MCAECHTTNLEKNFDVASNTYNTTWSDIDVAYNPSSLEFENVGRVHAAGRSTSDGSFGVFHQPLNGGGSDPWDQTFELLCEPLVA